MNWLFAPSGSMVIMLMTLVGWSFPEVESGWGWNPYRMYKTWRASKNAVTEENAVGSEAITQFLASALQEQTGHEGPLKLLKVTREGGGFRVTAKADVVVSDDKVRYLCSVDVVKRTRGRKWTLEKAVIQEGVTLCRNAGPLPRQQQQQRRGGVGHRRPSQSPSGGSPSPSRRSSVSSSSSTLSPAGSTYSVSSTGSSYRCSPTDSLTGSTYSGNTGRSPRGRPQSYP